MYGEFSQGNLKRWEIIVENTHVRKLTQLADFKDSEKKEADFKDAIVKIKIVCPYRGPLRGQTLISCPSLCFPILVKTVVNFSSSSNFYYYFFSVK